MKALTLTQPWATLVAIGEKHFETRSWGTKNRGPVAIHAAMGFPRHARDLCNDEPFDSTLLRHGYSGWGFLPRGAVLAVCEIGDCFRTAAGDDGPDEQEAAFGDFSVGRYAWRLDNVRRLSNPIVIPGHLGLWGIDDAVINAALGLPS